LIAYVAKKGLTMVGYKSLDLFEKDGLIVTKYKGWIGDYTKITRKASIYLRNEETNEIKETNEEIQVHTLSKGIREVEA
jgi:hypothetical protein